MIDIAQLRLEPGAETSVEVPVAVPAIELGGRMALELAGTGLDDVDLIDLRSASPVMAMQVLASGRVLLDLDPVARGAFEDRVFGAYARLNEERRGILERVKAEGTVYGR